MQFLSRWWHKTDSTLKVSVLPSRPGANSYQLRPTCSPEFKHPLGLSFALTCFWPFGGVTVVTDLVSAQQIVQKQEVNGIFSRHLKEDSLCFTFVFQPGLDSQKCTFNSTLYVGAVQWRTLAPNCTAATTKDICLPNRINDLEVSLELKILRFLGSPPPSQGGKAVFLQFRALTGHQWFQQEEGTVRGLF